MRPDRNARAASISVGGLGILPMGSVAMATIGALPESMRRSHGKRSATRRKNRIRLNRWSSSGAGVSCGSRPMSDADAGARCKQAHDLRRSRLDLPTKKPRCRPATTMADGSAKLRAASPFRSMKGSPLRRVVLRAWCRRAISRKACRRGLRRNWKGSARGRFQKEEQTRIDGGRDRDRTCDPYHVKKTIGIEYKEYQRARAAKSAPECTSGAPIWFSEPESTTLRASVEVIAEIAANVISSALWFMDAA
jgi:hypothetical protein